MKESDTMLASGWDGIQFLRDPRLFLLIYLANRKRKSVAVSLKIAGRNCSMIHHEQL